MVMCRGEEPLGKDIREKIALFANLPVSSVVSARDVDSIYKVPLEFEQEGVADRVLDHFGMGTAPPDLSDWQRLVDRVETAREPVRIALVGKYNQLADAYLSVIEALNHGGIHHGGKVEVHWVDSERLTDGEVEAELATCDGILVPGGFGVRGIEGKIKAARFARERGVPYLGICLGMQIAVSEFARHVAGMEGANSSEFDPETPYPVVDLLPEQKEVRDMGGTMRLGADPVKLHEGTRVREIYGEAVIYERHRHRYEVNNFLRKRLEHAGLVFSGTSPDDRLVEVIELPDHPFFVASQYHPEFKSRPLRPQPLFRDFVGAAMARARGDAAPERAPEVEPPKYGGGVARLSRRARRSLPAQAERAAQELRQSLGFGLHLLTRPLRRPAGERLHAQRELCPLALVLPHALHAPVHQQHRGDPALVAVHALAVGGVEQRGGVARGADRPHVEAGEQAGHLHGRGGGRRTGVLAQHPARAALHGDGRQLVAEGLEHPARRGRLHAPPARQVGPRGRPEGAQIAARDLAARLLAVGDLERRRAASWPVR